MLFVFCCLCYGCFFFFFKQKTAYEMRISDWSSDVCSSDLNGDTMRTVDPVVNEALSDLKAYLNDGYDPRLIVEQLVVLRRAQKLRRRGRRTEAATMP